MTGIATETAAGVLTITLDRPGHRNALDVIAQTELVRVLEAAALDESLRVVHVTGRGDHFCAGADMVAANSGDRSEKPRPASLVRRLPLQSHRIIELLLTLQLPVVASVRGAAAGLGCQLALAADFAIAAEDATFWEPFLRRGFTPDTGSTWLLPRLVGIARARRMILLGEKVTGATAAEWGLVHDAVGAADLETAAADLVAGLAAGPTVALGLAKQLLVDAADASPVRAMADEAHALELATRTRDFREGIQAFAQRRDPDFEGR